MILDDNKLTRLQTLLDVLDGLTKAFTNLDQMFDDLTADAVDGVSPKDSDRYASHCQLLSDLHTVAVDELTSLRDDIVCTCGDAECSA